MGRIIGSVIAGYLTMAVAVFVLLSVAYLVLGASGSFQPGSWDPSTLWNVLGIGMGIVAAITGGFVCAAIAKNPRGPQTLIGVVIVLGLLFAIPALTGQSAEVASAARPETVTLLEAVQNARQPVWVALLNPLLGAIGIVIGARLYGSSQPQTT